MEDDKKQEQPKKKNRILKKIFKVLFFIVAGFLALNVLLFILLSIPAIQQKVADFALKQIKNKIQTEVSIGKVRLQLFNRADLQDIYIETQQGDTLLYAGSLEVHLDFWKLFDSQLLIKSIDLQNAVVNLAQDNPDAPFNFQFIVDAFASDTTQQKESSSSLAVSIDDLKIKNTRVNYDVVSEYETPGIFNVSHIGALIQDADLVLSSIDVPKLDIEVKFLSLVEKSGVVVEKLETHIHSKGTTFWLDKLDLNLPASYLTITDIRYNLLNKEFTFKGNSNVTINDVLPFMPELANLSNNIVFTADASGKLPLVNINELQLEYGQDLSLQATASVDNFQEYQESRLNLSLDRFKVTPKAITQFARIADPTFVAPEMLETVEYIRLKGTVNGYLSNLNINLDGWTNQGAIEVNGTASTDTLFENIAANLNVQTQNFNIAPFVGEDLGLGKISLHSNIKIEYHNDLALSANGVVNNLQYQGKDLNNIFFKAGYSPTEISGDIRANLPIGRIRADGSFTQGRNQHIVLNAEVDTVHVDFFYDNPQWERPRLTLRLNGDLSGENIDNWLGSVLIDSLVFRGDNFNWEPGPITVESGINNNQVRYISLNSEFATAYMIGQFRFLNLADEITALLSNYMPTFFENTRTIRTFGNNFGMSVFVKNTELISQIFDLPVAIIEPLSLNGRINTIDSLISFNGDIPHIKFNDNDIENAWVEAQNSPSVFNINADGEYIQADSLRASINVDIEADTVHVDITLRRDDPELPVNGNINALIHFDYGERILTSTVNLLPTHLDVGSLHLDVLPAQIVNREGQTTISNFGLELNGQDYLSIDGVISPLPEDSLRIWFNDAQIGELLGAIQVENIKAEANGGVVLTRILDQPEFYTDGLRFEDIIIFNDSLGDLTIESHWRDSEGAVIFDATLLNAYSRNNIQGEISTRSDSLNVVADFDRFSLDWIQPFVDDFLNRLTGSLSTHLEITGTTESPSTQGWLGFNDVSVGIDYTNVTYYTSDTIKVLPDSIGFRDLAIYDNNGSQALLSALVTHQNFKNLEYLAWLRMQDFMVLNTANRSDSLFYGRVIASGEARIRGSQDNIQVNLNITNEENSRIDVTLPESSDAATYQSIVYINVPEQDSTEYVNILPDREEELPLKLNLDLTITSGITVGVLFDQIDGNSMEVNGTGQVNFTYDLQSEEMRAFGDYVLNDGSVRLQLQGLSIAALEFRIQDGSKLTFSGDPLQTNFDITAYRRVRASLSTLDESFPTGRIPVDCVLKIKGNIQNIEVSYDISLPEASDDTRSKVRSLINTEEQRITQFAYLLVSGSFHSDTGANLGGNVLTSLGSSLLSSGLDKVFGSVLGDKWEIGTNISTSDGSFSDVDVSVNLSTRLLDDRLRLNTNLGYRTEPGVSDEEFVGDFDLEYILTNNWSLRAYNKTNEKLYRQAQSTMTQGIGVSYTKEAKRLKDLFRSFRRRNRTQTETTNTETGN